MQLFINNRVSLAGSKQKRRAFWQIGIVVSFLCVLFPVYTLAQEKMTESVKLASLSSSDLSTEGLSRMLETQIEQYDVHAPKSVIELQQFRKVSSITIRNNKGQHGVATLTNLNPWINTWFLLTLEWDGGKHKSSFHLENRSPLSQKLVLDPRYPYGIVIASDQKRFSCDLWSGFSQTSLNEAKNSRSTYVPLCGQQLYLRNQTRGHKTTKEWATDFLRNHVPGGEEFTMFVKETVYKDAFLRTSDVLSAEETGESSVRHDSLGFPAPPLVNPLYKEDYLVPRGLGIELEHMVENKVQIGHWYQVKDLPGIFISVIQPKLVAEEVIESQKKLVANLDSTESSALVYLVAFDLDRFEVGFAMGTEHPGVDWSDRIRLNVRDNTLPGPDGINTVEPLVNTGMINPAEMQRIAMTFIGGFKRYHGAFKYGDLALKNSGSHYGFIENGVVMSKLQPGLSTALVFADGTVALKTWTEKDNAILHKIRHARQNGVAIIEYDEATRVSKPGRLVNRWGPGNWSGSAKGEFRSLRAGLGIQEQEGSRFLIYGYFSSATPSAMARVFQAYGCKYAMHLDMNALEHTYLAVYRAQESQFLPEHLIEGMDELDKSNDEQVVPRFIGYADNRDFFYLLRKRRVHE
jgi:hypothetical protein